MKIIYELKTSAEGNFYEIFNEHGRILAKVYEFDLVVSIVEALEKIKLKEFYNFDTAKSLLKEGKKVTSKSSMGSNFLKMDHMGVVNLCFNNRVIIRDYFFSLREIETVDWEIVQ